MVKEILLDIVTFWNFILIEIIISSRL